jgi:hypothetical protein
MPKDMMLRTLIMGGDPPTYGAKPIHAMREVRLEMCPNLGLVTQVLVDCIGGPTWINADPSDIITREHAQARRYCELDKWQASESASLALKHEPECRCERLLNGHEPGCPYVGGKAGYWV